MGLLHQEPPQGPLQTTLCPVPSTRNNCPPLTTIKKSDTLEHHARIQTQNAWPLVYRIRPMPPCLTWWQTALALANVCPIGGLPHCVSCGFWRRKTFTAQPGGMGEAAKCSKQLQGHSGASQLSLGLGGKQQTLCIFREDFLKGIMRLLYRKLLRAVQLPWWI